MQEPKANPNNHNDRSADWHSAVSRVGNPEPARRCARPEAGAAADCQSAIQQTASLRYKAGQPNPSIDPERKKGFVVEGHYR